MISWGGGAAAEGSMIRVRVAEINAAWMKNQYYLTAGLLQVCGNDQFVLKDKYDFLVKSHLCTCRLGVTPSSQHAACSRKGSWWSLSL